jgi:23S rRNA (uracil1939-C5)-methyltransferase
MFSLKVYLYTSKVLQDGIICAKIKWDQINFYLIRKKRKIMKKNDIYTVEVTDLTNLGSGFARIDNMAVFIPGAVDGDILEIKIIKVLSDYSIARIEKIIEPSEKRRTPSCPLFGKCGGCTFSNTTFEHENEIKRSYVENAFKKAGIIARVEPTAAISETGYRCKVEYPFSKEGGVGLYKARSHEVFETVECERQHERISEVLPFIDSFFRERVKSGKYTVYDEKTGKGLLRHLYLRYAKGTDSLMVCLVINSDSIRGIEALADALFEKYPFVRSFVININKKNTNVILGDKCRVIKGDEYIEDIILGNRFRFSPLSFCQINHEGMELLYKKAAELADIKDGDRVADLYCGVGTIGISLVSGKKNVSLVGIEIIPDAVNNANYNKEINKIENAEFICGNADFSEVENSDVIIVDPPRKGCGAELIKRIADISPKRVVYVSCGPDSLARDCAIFKSYGFEIGKVYPVNMFPGTGHVESVVCLKRQSDVI